MKILNFGSLNLDFVYHVSHFAAPGETLASESLDLNCGGKGLNQSIALARAGADVYHAGKVGSDGGALTSLLSENNVCTKHVRISEKRTGNAVIQVNSEGQNSIILYGGANLDIGREMADSVLEDFEPGDYILLQNEISCLGYIMEQARRAGLKIILNPSPADVSVKQLPLSYVSVFILNEIEGRMMTGESEPDMIITELRRLYPESAVVLTLGEGGVCYADGRERFTRGIFPVKAVDTTAAGDTFTGYFIAGLMRGQPVDTVLEIASMASSIAVSRPGASSSIPTLAEVEKALMSYRSQSGLSECSNNYV